MAPESRALLASVAASLVLHLLALILFPEVQLNAPNAGGTRILTATLAPRVAVPESLSAKPDVSIPDKPELRGAGAGTRRKREIPSPALAAPSPSPERIPETPASAATPLSAATPASPASPGAGTAGATGEVGTTDASAVPASPGTPGASKSPFAVSQGQVSQGQGGAPGRAAARRAGESDAITLSQYRLALIGAAKRYKRYPARAMEMGWQGRVEVRLVIDAGGVMQTASIKLSSGYEILDQQALDMVKKAKPLTPIPASLRGREFTIDIPVIFDLETG